MPARCGSPSCNRPASNNIRQPARIASPACRATVPGRGYVGCRGRAARPSAPSAAISARACSAVRNPRSTPSSSARVGSTRRSERGIGGQRGVERPDPALPVGERAGLLRHRRDREDHVGQRGDRRFAQLQADHEAGRLDGGQCGVRIGQVGGVDPADHQRVEVAVAAAAARISAVSRPASAGSSATCQAAAELLAGRRDRRPGGHRAAGWAGSRHPARRVPRPDAGSRPAALRCARPAARPRTAHRGWWPAVRRPG